MSIIGFDDQEALAGHTVPALTTVALPHAAMGEAAWYDRVADRATTLYPRLQRPRGERFAHPESGRGYRMDEVDDLLDRLAAYFDDGEPLSADDVRQATFRPARGKKAYAEGPVDAFLGRAVDILLAVD